MKKKIFGGIAVVAIAVAVAFNVSLNMSKNNSASLLALANVEAMADGETDEEFTNATGCVACTDPDHICKGKDGVRYSFAHKL